MKRSHCLSLTCVVALLCSCNLVTKDPRTEVVDRMYAALANGDNDAHLDTLLPSNRRQFGINFMGLLSAFSISAGDVGLDLSTLTHFSFRDMRYSVDQSGPDHAVVRAEGKIRMSILVSELSFCQQLDTRLENGQWCVDALAPETQARTQRVIARNQQRLMEAGLGQASVSDMTKMYEITLNLCE